MHNERVDAESRTLQTEFSRHSEVTCSSLGDSARRLVGYLGSLRVSLRPVAGSQPTIHFTGLAATTAPMRVSRHPKFQRGSFIAFIAGEHHMYGNSLDSSKYLTQAPRSLPKYLIHSQSWRQCHFHHLRTAVDYTILIKPSRKGRSVGARPSSCGGERGHT